jgi:hypothetical protein
MRITNRYNALAVPYLVKVPSGITLHGVSQDLRGRIFLIVVRLADGPKVEFC